MISRTLAFALTVASVLADSQRPHGLLCESRRHPAIGIAATSPRFSWVVGHIHSCGPDQAQVSYQLHLVKGHRGTDPALLAADPDLWDTGRQNSTKSVAVRHETAKPLAAATRYHWRVRVWSVSGDHQLTTSAECASEWSDWAEIMTAPLGGFAWTAQPIWYPESQGAAAQYTLHRITVATKPSPVTAATAFVTASISHDEKVLGAYRLMVNGAAVGIGPGRGDVAVAAGNHTFFDSIDVSNFCCSPAMESITIGLQCFHSGGGSGAGVLLELHLEHADGSESIIATGNNTTWRSFDATAAYNPGNQSEGPGYHAPQENIDAALMPVAWSTADFVEDKKSWLPSRVQSSVFAQAMPYPKPALPLNITERLSPVRWLQASPSCLFADFGTEFMGGLRLEVPAGALPARTVLQVTLSEELVGNPNTSTTLLFPMRTGNRYRSVWTTAAAALSVFEHHEFMSFRYAEVCRMHSTVVTEGGVAASSSSSSAAPNMTLTAWVVAYPFFEGESSFKSSSAMLNSVWKLCENSLRVTSLDTTTDSNTRERLPYEADGFLTGLSHLALQREFEWTRHSWRHNIWNPTWPTEWRQTIALFAALDYDATGSLELVDQFAIAMLNQTQTPCVGSLGLVDFENCERQAGGMGVVDGQLRDIVDWPMDARDNYDMQNINTVINAYQVGGLRTLARLGAVGGGASQGLPALAKKLEVQANATEAALNSLCTDSVSGLYFDGYNSTSMAPLKHSAWHAQVFPAAFGLVPEKRWPKILAFLKREGMIGSVYAAFWALKAAYGMDSDHGVVALQLMTSCDTNSWCHMLSVGATATMEAWSREEKPNLSWSHPWASAPASAMVWGLFGITASSPAFRKFMFKPQPGNLSFASIEVPTMSGTIAASLSQTSTSFAVTLAPPPNTFATVCLPRLNLPDASLTVDGVAKLGRYLRDYVCIDGVGSAAKPRVIVRG